ncbi:MAG: NADH-quinone oxidoreductase subunit C/D [bacterium]|nr:NADH-quinone oxidoreductase subunit C/D [bacterium]
MQSSPDSTLDDLRGRLGPEAVTAQPAADGMPTYWVARDRLPDVLRYFKHETAPPFAMLFDLTAIDERSRRHRAGRPPTDFTVVYHLLSLERGDFVRLKVALRGERPSLPSATALWPAADWYEREVWDMFGIVFDGHPNLRRILMPRHWRGHPLRKEHPARATEMGPSTPAFAPPELTPEAEEEELKFHPEEWGLAARGDGVETMFLNLGPQHPGTHGVLRLVVQLDGETIIDVVPEIGYHHRGAEKMGERQSWHTYIPYTDRVDYLAGVLNNLAYLESLEKLCGVEVPPRGRMARVMLCELFRIASHLVWYGTFAQDVGALSPVFFMFNDRERILDIIEAVTGARMHPGWLRIGGLADDLPRGWDGLVRDFLAYMPARLDEYDRLVMRNLIFRKRTQGVGTCTAAEAVEWGVTGPNLRACGLAWDLRKRRPYGGYEQFEFEIPTADRGDCYDRGTVRVAEIRQSLRIIRQCLDGMPPGPYKADHPLAVPPRKERTMHDIETLITHFLAVGWGPVVPPGEALVPIESSKGQYGYYLVSDGGTMSYRTRIRSPSFAHMQVLPRLARGAMIPDLLAILGSIDFVLADVDR